MGLKDFIIHDELIMYKPTIYSQKRNCEICGGITSNQPHHIFTVGANKDDAYTAENEIWLCGPHHVEAQSIGVKTWARKYHLEARVRVARITVKGF
jgi:hypothetical protein